MINERINNILFDIRKIKCELAFINKAKHIEQCEQMKILLNKEFNCITMDIPNNDNANNDDEDKDKNDTQLQCTTKTLTFYLSFSEREDVNVDDSLLLFNHVTFTLFVAISESDKSNIFISIYEKNKALIDNKFKRYLSHLLIFTDTNEDTDFNKPNVADHVHICTNSIEEIKNTIHDLLKRILIDNYTQIKSKPDLVNSDGSLLIKDLIEIKERCEECIQIGMFTIPMICYPLLSEMIKIPTEKIKFKECQVLIMIIIDYYCNKDVQNELIFNTEVEKLFDEVFQGYKKSKQQSLLLESYLRLGVYYSLFKDKLSHCLDTIQKAYMECINSLPKQKVKILLNAYMLLNEIGYKRKGCLYLYLAIAACYESPSDLLNIIPYLFKEMNKTFCVYDIYENQIDSIEVFNAIHQELYINGWKRISFEECLRGENHFCMSRVNKKRIEKDYYLKVTNNFIQYDHLLPGANTMQEAKWAPILYNIYLNLLTYYKSINNAKMIISYTLSLLQILKGFLSQNEQSNLMKDHLKYSSLLQEKLHLNMPYMPVLVGIIPIEGNIKLEKKNKFSVDANKQNVFLYNPWGKSEVNYYWTVNSFQTILIKLFNPLSIPLTLTKISIVFERQIPFLFPSSTILEPNSAKEILFKIRPLNEGLTTIRGIKYEIENTSSTQFVDENGNGILYQIDNTSKEACSSLNSKKESIMVSNIQIHPEIPLLDMKVLDDSSKLSVNEPLELYEYQYYSFSFLLENISVYPIESINIFIYAYKKDDYKVLLDEISLGNNNRDGWNCLIERMGNYVYNYNYIHRKKHKKIELRFYYKYNTEVYDSIAMKPFCYYSRRLSSKKLFNFNNIKTAAMLSNNTIRDIIKNDPRIKSGFCYCFSTKKYYISFDANIVNDNMTINYDITNGEHLIKKGSISGIEPIEISLVAKDVTRLNDISLNWELNNNNNEPKLIIGKIDLFKLVINELEYKFNDGLVFDIKIKEKINEDGIECLEVIHSITNKSKTLYSKLRFSIYLYQTNEGVLLFNTHLNPNVFYEGSLLHLIKELKPNEYIEYSLLLYILKGETINTTCLLIDDTYKIIYIPTITKQCRLSQNNLLQYP